MRFEVRHSLRIWNLQLNVMLCDQQCDIVGCHIAVILCVCRFCYELTFQLWFLHLLWSLLNPLRFPTKITLRYKMLYKIQLLFDKIPPYKVPKYAVKTIRMVISSLNWKTVLQRKLCMCVCNREIRFSKYIYSVINVMF